MMLDSPHTSVSMLMRGNTPPTTRSPPHRSRPTGDPPNRQPATVGEEERGMTPSLVRDGQTSPHRPRLVVSRSTCPPISPLPHASSFVLGPAVINTHTISSPGSGAWGISEPLSRCRYVDLEIWHGPWEITGLVRTKKRIVVIQAQIAFTDVLVAPSPPSRAEWARSG